MWECCIGDFCGTIGIGIRGADPLLVNFLLHVSSEHRGHLKLNTEGPERGGEGA